jgi:hypothetical protein
MSGETTTLPDGSQARLRIHRTGSVEAMVGGRPYHLGPAGGAAGGAATSPGPTSMNSPGGSGGGGSFAMGDLAGSHGGVSPGAAFLGSSGLAHSVLAQSSFSSNIHNSRAVLAALRALQDKIRTLEVRRCVIVDVDDASPAPVAKSLSTPSPSPPKTSPRALRTSFLPLSSFSSFSSSSSSSSSSPSLFSSALLSSTLLLFY